VLGNHDHFADSNEVRHWLTSIGMTVLVNEAHHIHRAHGASTLQIAGIDDSEKGSVDPLAGIRPADADLPTVVFSHHPDGVELLSRDRRVDLVLAGHTHGGQVVLPVIGAPLTLSQICGHRTASGWVPNDRAPLYVSRGVGTQIPLRIGCPPEVLVVRLRRS
jgi:predicted MPP superfamily phosphohydrolase